VRYGTVFPGGVGRNFRDFADFGVHTGRSMPGKCKENFNRPTIRRTIVGAKDQFFLMGQGPFG